MMLSSKATPSVRAPLGARKILACASLAVALMGLTPACATAQAALWARAGGPLFADAVPEAEAASNADTASIVEAPEQPYAALIAETAARHGLDPKLLHALVAVESAYQSGACSRVGACGLTQLMPATARELDVTDRLEPVQNLRGGADYLARQLRRFGDLRLALAAYNSGPERVGRLGRVPDIGETKAYVAAVIDCYLALTAGREIRSGRDCVAPESSDDPASQSAP